MEGLSTDKSSKAVHGGQVVGDLMPEAELFARMELADGSLIEPKESLIAAENGHFRLFFPDLDAAVSQDCRLVLLVLTR